MAASSSLSNPRTSDSTQPIGVRGRRWLAAALLPTLAGCLAVAAGAGAAGGVAFTKRGAESVVDARFDRVLAASQQALPQFGIRVGKTGRSHDSEEGKREATIEGHGTERGTEVAVKLKQKGRGSVYIHVVAKRSDVKWDKDFARRILDRIVTLAR